jgi:hypothetical protein
MAFEISLVQELQINTSEGFSDVSECRDYGTRETYVHPNSLKSAYEILYNKHRWLIFEPSKQFYRFTAFI